MVLKFLCYLSVLAWPGTTPLHSLSGHLCFWAQTVKSAGLSFTFWFSSLVFRICGCSNSFYWGDKKLIQTGMESFAVIWCLKTTAGYAHSVSKSSDGGSYGNVRKAAVNCLQVISRERQIQIPYHFAVILENSCKLEIYSEIMWMQMWVILSKMTVPIIFNNFC